MLVIVEISVKATKLYQSRCSKLQVIYVCFVITAVLCCATCSFVIWLFNSSRAYHVSQLISLLSLLMTQCIKTESVINKRSSRVLFIPILSLQNFSLSQFQYGIRASWLGVLHRFLTHPSLLGFFLEDFSLCNFFPLSSIIDLLFSEFLQFFAFSNS